MKVRLNSAERTKRTWLKEEQRDGSFTGEEPFETISVCSQIFNYRLDEHLGIVILNMLSTVGADGWNEQLIAQIPDQVRRVTYWAAECPDVNMAHDKRVYCSIIKSHSERFAKIRDASLRSQEEWSKLSPKFEEFPIVYQESDAS